MVASELIQAAPGVRSGIVAKLLPKNAGPAPGFPLLYGGQREAAPWNRRGSVTKTRVPVTAAIISILVSVLPVIVAPSVLAADGPCSIRVFLCPEKPEGAEHTWDDQGCVIKAEHRASVEVGTSTITRQAPRKDGGEAHGTGWWVGCNVYNVQYTSQSGMVAGNARYFSA